MLANKPTASLYTPARWRSPAGSAPTVARLPAGRYTVAFPGILRRVRPARVGHAVRGDPGPVPGTRLVRRHRPGGPTTSRHTPPATHTANPVSRPEAREITRLGTGRYRVGFLGVPASFGGEVQVTQWRGSASEGAA